MPLGSAAAIDDLVSRWHEPIAQEALAPGRASRRAEAAYRLAATALREKVWDPVAPHLKGAKSVFLVPDGVLQLVNFAALPVDQTSYLIETGPLIHYLSAERDLVPTATENGEWQSAGTGVSGIRRHRIFCRPETSNRRREHASRPVGRFGGTALTAKRSSRCDSRRFRTLLAKRRRLSASGRRNRSGDRRQCSQSDRAGGDGRRVQT